MPIDITDLVSKMEWAAQRGLSEYTSETDGLRISIKRQGTPSAEPTVTNSENPASNQPVADPEPQANTITAPLAGLCHLQSEAGSAPFIAVGDVITEGQTICIIEAMKFMTSIPATRAGTVREILVADGTTVEPGTPLVALSA